MDAARRDLAARARIPLILGAVLASAGSGLLASPGGAVIGWVGVAAGTWMLARGARNRRAVRAAWKRMLGDSQKESRR